MDILGQDAATVNVQTGRASLEKWKAKGDEYGMLGGIGLASMCLVETAEEYYGVRIGFETPKNLIATLLGFAACKSAMTCIETSLPTSEEITEDAYWGAMEVLDAAGLDFENLLNFHCDEVMA